MTDLTDRYNEICDSFEQEDEWSETPEPNKNELNPQVILDTNIDGQAWLWNTQNPDANLTFHGETMEVME